MNMDEDNDEAKIDMIKVSRYALKGFLESELDVPRTEHLSNSLGSVGFYGDQHGICIDKMWTRLT